MDCFVGSSDMNFTGATTSGFSYSVDNAKTIRFHDIPLSSLAASELDYQLLQSRTSLPGGLVKSPRWLRPHTIKVMNILGEENLEEITSTVTVRTRKGFQNKSPDLWTDGRQ